MPDGWCLAAIGKRLLRTMARWIAGDIRSMSDTEIIARGHIEAYHLMPRLDLVQHTLFTLRGPGKSFAREGCFAAE